MTTTKKITLATLKSFIKKNHDNLYIKNLRDFDGMVDCVMPNPGAEFRPATFTEAGLDYNLGVKGVYVVRSSRDYFYPFEDDQFTGIEVSNCCGGFIVAIKREV